MQRFIDGAERLNERMNGCVNACMALPVSKVNKIDGSSPFGWFPQGLLASSRPSRRRGGREATVNSVLNTTNRSEEIQPAPTKPREGRGRTRKEGRRRKEGRGRKEESSK